MIIVGFPGIGKSWLASMSMMTIDLESSMMSVDGKRPDEWVKIYVNIAIDLSKQGKNVFVSSHKAVRDELEMRDEEALYIYPSLSLKDEWIAMLKRRYERTKLEKDLKALNYMGEHYEEAVKDMMDNAKERFIELNETPESYYDRCMWKEWKEKLHL